MFFICTAFVYKNPSTVFGRNLDLEYSNGENVIITPRNFAFSFAEEGRLCKHFAIIGAGIIAKDVPLYYDGMNEHGLYAAALNFPENAVYMRKKEDKTNIAPFEFIPFVLGKCKTLAEAKRLLEHTNILSTDFSPEMKNTPLHWFVADKTGAFAAEPTVKGLVLTEDLAGVLTNEPPLDYHLINMRNFLSITAEEPKNRFAQNLDLTPYSRGMGGIGLPGDFSSASRFIKTVFIKENSPAEKTGEEALSQAFHILENVSMPKGSIRLEKGFEKTVYSSCADAKSGIYYYKTYENSRICAVDMKKEDLDGKSLASYPMLFGQDVFWQN